MNLLPVSNNITELLTKTIEFTKVRHKILIKNIHSIHTPGFIPKDLPADEFAQALNDALYEHVQYKRLSLRDSENIKFLADAGLEIKTITDKYSNELFDTNKDEYLELQIRKIFENSINQWIAKKLLRQQEVTSDIENRPEKHLKSNTVKAKLFPTCSDNMRN